MVDLTCCALGRRQVVRATRFALHRARLDVPNIPASNGEHALQQWVLETIRPTEPVTILDVGAHIGTWSLAFIDSARQTGHLPRLRLHAFEPSTYTYSILSSSVPDWVHTNQLALSDRGCTATLHIVHPGAGSNSLYDNAGDISENCASRSTETVRTTTLDEYVRDNGLRRIDLVKIDAEGHDFSVMLGAQESFRSQIISLVQFEYSYQWVYARRYLKDVFDVLEPLGYHVGKLTPHGVERYPRWNWELETFTEGNYLAGTETAIRSLPTVRWWKSPQPNRPARS